MLYFLGKQVTVCFFKCLHIDVHTYICFKAALRIFRGLQRTMQAHMVKIPTKDAMVIFIRET